MAESPFTVEVRDKAVARRGWVNDPADLTVTIRHNAVSTLALTIRDDHPRVPDLVGKGARVHLTYRGDLVFTGPVRHVTGSGPAKAGRLVVSCEDDKRLLWRVLGWPNPTGAITAQGAATAYDEKTGPAETVLRWFISRNATRLGIPVTFDPAIDGERGSTVTVKARMHVLADRLLPAVDQAGIGFQVTRSAAGYLVSIYEPVTYPRTLSEANGTIVDWSYSTAAPDATRAVVGGQGEGTAREFRARVNTAAEAAWGDIVEVFRDARDTDDAAELDQRGDQTLAEAGERTGLALQLAETGSFRYRGPAGVREGDTVPVQVGPLAVVTDVVREVTLTWSPGEGLRAVPATGGWDNDPTRVLARAVGKLASAVRDLRSSR